MAQANIDIVVKTETLGDLDQKLALLNDEIKEVGINSKEFKKLSKEIQGVQLASDKANKSIKGIDYGALAGDVAKVSAGLGAAGLALSSFAGENEEMQEVLQKTNVILALAATGEAIYTATKKDGEIATIASKAATKASAIATAAATAAQAAYTFVVGTSTGALKLFKLALAATGLGLIVIAIGLLVANWDELTESVDGSSSKLEEFGKFLLFLIGPLGWLVLALDKVAESIGGWGALFDATIGGIKAFGEAVGDVVSALFSWDFEALDESLDTFKDKVVEGTKEAIEAGAEARRLAQEIARREAAQEDLDYYAKVLEAMGASEEEIYNAKKMSLENQLFLLKEELGVQSKEYKEAHLKLLKLNTDFNKKIAADNEKAAKEAEAERKKAADKEAKDAKANADAKKKAADKELKDAKELAKRLEKVHDAGIKEKLDSSVSAEKDLISAITISGLSQERKEEEITATKVAFTKARIKLINDELKEQLEAIEQEFTAVENLVTLRAIGAGKLSEVTKQIAELRLKADAQAATAERKAQERGEKYLTLIDDTSDSIKAGKDEAKAFLASTDEALNAIGDGATKALGDSFLQGILDGTELAVTELETFIILQEKLLIGGNDFVNEKILEGIKENQDKILKARIKGLEDQRDLFEEGSLERIKILKEIAKLEKDLIEDSKVGWSDWADFAEDKFGETGKFIAEQFKEAFEGLNDIIDFNNQKIADTEAEYVNLSRAINKRYDDEVEAAGENADAIIIINGRRDAALGEAERAREEATNKLKIKNAKLQFALDIGSIVAKTALAIINQYATLPIAAAIPASIIVAGIGAIQIASAKKARDAAITAATPSALPDSSLSNDYRGQFASGGFVEGPGTGTSDSINARLSDGEFVVNAAATSANRNLLENINNAPKRFANGGINNVSNDRLEGVLAKIEKRLGVAPKAWVVASEIQAGLDSDEYLERRAQLTN